MIPIVEGAIGTVTKSQENNDAVTADQRNNRDYSDYQNHLELFEELLSLKLQGKPPFETGEKTLQLKNINNSNNNSYNNNDYDNYKKKKLTTVVEGDPNAPFSIATTPKHKGGRYSFPGLLHFTLDTYLILLSVKQGSINYHFQSLWYDATWDRTQVSRTIGEHSAH